MPFQFGVDLAVPVGDRDVDGLFGWCDDVAVEHDAARNRTRVRFDRVAPSLVDAIVSGVRDLDRAGLATFAVVPDDDLVTGACVAARLGRSAASTEVLLVGGPLPVWRCGDQPLYRWSQVAAWLDRGGARVAPGYAGPGAPVFDAINLALRLRTLAPRVDRMAAILSLITG